MYTCKRALRFEPKLQIHTTNTDLQCVEGDDIDDGDENEEEEEYDDDKTNEEKKTKTAVSAFQVFGGCISLPIALAVAVSASQKGPQSKV